MLSGELSQIPHCPSHSGLPCPPYVPTISGSRSSPISLRTICQKNVHKSWNGKRLCDWYYLPVVDPGGSAARGEEVLAAVIRQLGVLGRHAVPDQLRDHEEEAAEIVRDDHHEGEELRRVDVSCVHGGRLCAGSPVVHITHIIHHF